MGWANCGINPDTGAKMGYAFSGVCDEPGCEAKIDLGLGYVCGDMHGGGAIGCGKYFCGEHLTYRHDETGRLTQICQECAKSYDEPGEKE